ncbi:MAG: hypothetical protein JWN86_3944 [Planctomycetota bacterium]|nr:hypothetical protein [Planctomycetota bacterium]
MSDQFRPIAGFPGYRVNRKGVVQSRRGPGCRSGTTENWVSLKPIPRSRGYMTVNLSCCGRKSIRYVHRLVLESFVGACPEGMVGCHNDGDRTNNRVANLRWDTPTANEADKLRHGTRRVGSATACSKLSEVDVLEIRRRKGEGEPMRLLASEFGISWQNVQAIVGHRSWRHLPESPPIASSRVRPRDRGHYPAPASRPAS